MKEFSSYILLRYYSKVQNAPKRFRLQSPSKLNGKKGNMRSNDKLTASNLKFKSKKPSDNSLLSKTMFKYGDFGGLSKRDETTVYKNQSLIDKITNFEHLKLLPTTRSIIDKVLAQESILFDKEKTVSNWKDEFNENFEIKPTPIQTLVIKRLAKHLTDPSLKIHAIAADTGSGKTMAYLIPLLDYLLRTTESNKRKFIRSIILVPTHELVQQVYQTIKLCENSSSNGLHCEKWDIHTKYSDLLEKMKIGIDILVTSPTKLLNLYKTDIISNPNRILNQIEFSVVDEADTLMDPSWVNDTQKVIRQCHGLNHLLFCSATIPNEFNKLLNKFYPDCQVITTPRLHKLSKKLDFKVIDCRINPFKGSKLKTLAQILFSIKEKSKSSLEKAKDVVGQEKCIVFVNEKNEVESVANSLKDQFNFEDTVAISGNTSVEDRLKLIQQFITVDGIRETEQNKANERRNNESASEIINQENDIIKEDGNTDQMECIPGSNVIIPKATIKPTGTPIKVLVTTDLLARGLNFHNVRNVILYDVPRTSIDLVHRVGRTGRMNRKGTIFMIVDKKTKSWAKGIPKIIAKNMTLT